MNEVWEFLRMVSGPAGLVALIGLVATWVRTRPTMKKVELEGEQALWARITKLESDAEAERKACDDRIARMEERAAAALDELKGELRVMQHERNNVRQGLNMMFARIKKLPHPELSEIVAEVEDLIRCGDEVIAVEKAALSSKGGLL